MDIQEQELASLVIKGLEGYGMSAKKLNGDALAIAGVAKFDSENHADDADDAIENLMDLQQFEKIEVAQKGDLLKAMAEVDIENAVPLF